MRQRQRQWAACLDVTCVHLFGPCCTAGSSCITAMLLQTEEIRRMADPPRACPPAKVKHRLLPPPLAHFPPLWRGPRVIHTSLSLHSKPSSCGYKLSLLTLPCSTDTAWMGIKIHSQPYLAHLYIQNMCLGSFPLHRHLFNSESTPSTQKRRREKKQVWSLSDVFFRQINQTPLITQMIEIQLFAEWYTVLINLNLHCMSLELIFLFLIQGNLAGGSDWINRSRFSYSDSLRLYKLLWCDSGPGSSVPSGGAVFSQLARSSSWQGCDLRPPETQLEWTGETDYTAGWYITALSKWDTQNGLSDTQNGPWHIAVVNLGCLLNWSDSYAGQDGFRPLPSQENLRGKRQLYFICTLLNLKRTSFHSFTKLNVKKQEL